MLFLYRGIVMQIDILELLSDICHHQGLQIFLFKEDFAHIEDIDYGFRRKMAINFDYHFIISHMEQNLEHGIQYLYTDDLKLYYCLYRFPEHLKKEFDCQIICIGPVLIQPMNKSTFYALMERNAIPPQFYQDFLEFYNRIPIISAIEIWCHTLNLFFEKMTSSPVIYRMVSSDCPELFSMQYADYSIPDTPNVALNTIEERYQWEDEMLAAVAAGNFKRATDAYFHFRQYRLLPRVPDPVRNQKNLMITFNTLLRKTVQASQVHPLHIDNLSQQFAIQIESLLTLDQLRSLSVTMLRKYCLLVNNYSRQSYSQLVRSCMDYIDFHYNEALSLTILAQKNAVSASYLSGLFKKENGMTLTDYINTTRIRQALILLNTTSLSVGTIAARCGFPDSNYFTRTFKKYQGKTPKAYREFIWGYSEVG